MPRKYTFKPKEEELEDLPETFTAEPAPAEEKKTPEIPDLQEDLLGIKEVLSRSESAQDDPQVYEMVDLMVRTAKQIDLIAMSDLRNKLSHKHRVGLEAVRVFIRQVLGQKAGPMEYATLKDWLGDISGPGGVFGAVGRTRPIKLDDKVLRKAGVLDPVLYEE